MATRKLIKRIASLAFILAAVGSGGSYAIQLTSSDKLTQNEIQGTQEKSSVYESAQLFLQRQANLADIKVNLETIQQMSMDDVQAIADKAYNREVKNAKLRYQGKKRQEALAKISKPIDRVVLFLQKEQLMEQAEKEKKRLEAIEELVTEQKAKQQEEKRLQVEGKDNKVPADSAKQLDNIKTALRQSANKTQGVASKDKSIRSEQLVQTNGTLESATLSEKSAVVNQALKVPNMQQIKTGAVVTLTNDHVNKSTSGNQTRKAAVKDERLVLTQINAKQEAKKEIKKKVQKNVESTNPFDNMSLSEIIARKYKKTVSEIRSPQLAAKLLVKDTSEFDVNAPDYAKGTEDQQRATLEKLGNIETDLAPTWSDLSDVKQRLWNQLHNQISQTELKHRISKSLNLAQKKGGAKKLKRSKPVALVQKSDEAEQITELSQKGSEGKLRVQYGIAFYEVDVGVIAIIIILAVIVLVCVSVFITFCCCIRKAAEDAKAERAEALSEWSRQNTTPKDQDTEPNLKQEQQAAGQQTGQQKS